MRKVKAWRVGSEAVNKAECALLQLSKHQVSHTVPGAAGGPQYVLELPIEQLRAALRQPPDPDEQRPQRAIVPVSLGPPGSHPGSGRYEMQTLNWTNSHSMVSPEEVSYFERAAVSRFRNVRWQ